MTAGRYWTYPEYKDSGVGWVGKVPMHWKLTPLKYLCRFNGGGTPSKDNPDYWNGNVPWVSPKDMNQRRITATIDRITDAAITESSTSLVDAGALLMVVRSGILKHSIPVAINDVPVALNQDMKALRFNDRVNVNFAQHVFSGHQRSLLLEWSKQGATVESIEQEYLANTYFPTPPIAEQNQISAFLNHETVRIDILIDRQQQLIALLKEKRQAVISHAVTKGLNPDAPMKDSGVEWLGEVPKHWVVTRLKYECSHIVDCLHSTPTYDIDGEYPAIRTADIFLGKLDIDNARRVFANVFFERNIRLVPESEDIIYSREGERFGIGALVPEGVKVCLGQRVMLFRARSSPRFLMWALNAESTYKQAQQDVIGSTSPHVNVETIKNFFIAWPPIEERIAISSHIENLTASMDKITAIAESKIQLLQERRTALISAAVTGKIDVRHWQPPHDTPPPAEDTP